MKQLQTSRVQVSVGIRRPVCLWFRCFLDGRLLLELVHTWTLKEFLGEALLSLRRDTVRSPELCKRKAEVFPRLHRHCTPNLG